MNTEDLKKQIQEIVKESCKLKDKYTNEYNAIVNYACIFSQNQEEFKTLIRITSKIGRIIKNTSTGPLFNIYPINTVSGNLKLLKIRNPDKSRPECGDADFTISNFPEFEKKYLNKTGFKIMKKPDFYMIELMDSNFDVRTYFSNPPLDEQLNVK